MSGQDVAYKPKVLVVDDEQLIANTITIILNSAGFEAQNAFTAQGALELLDVFRPEILLTDVAMPGMDGIELAIAILSKLPDCKIFLFSGQATTAELLDKAISQGHVFEILAKPIHPEHLMAKLRGDS
jgi:CheY-like chemotaxis protein